MNGIATESQLDDLELALVALDRVAVKRLLAADVCTDVTPLHGVESHGR